MRQAAQARLQQEDTNSGRFLQELSVTQELFASDRESLPNQGPKRVAVFLWRFRRAWPGEAAVTIWRRLNHPNQPSGVEPSVGHMTMQPAIGSTSSPLTSQNKEPGVESAYLGGGEPQMEDPTMQYDLSAASYWDSHWVNSQLASHGEAPDTHAVNASFQSCPSTTNLGYSYVESSPTTTQNGPDSGYCSQATSYISHTPMMKDTHPANTGDGVGIYSIGNAVDEGAQTGDHYSDLQHLREMTMSHFNAANLGYESHNHLEQQELVDRMSAQEEMASRMHSVSDPNLYNFHGGHIQLGYGLANEHESTELSHLTGLGISNAALEMSSQLSSDHHRSVLEPSVPSSGAHQRDHGSSVASIGLHAPQPLHPSGTPGVPLLASSDTALHFSASHAAPPSLSTMLPGSAVSHGLPSVSSRDPCSPLTADASMLLHLAQSHPANATQYNHDLRAPNDHPNGASGSHPNEANQQESPRGGDGRISVSSVDSAGSVGSIGSVAAALWSTHHDPLASQLPSGLFLDVGAGLGLSATTATSAGNGAIGSSLHAVTGAGHSASNSHTHHMPGLSSCPSTSAGTDDGYLVARHPGLLETSRDRAQETGRILGELLGTARSVAGARTGTSPRDDDQDAERRHAWTAPRDYVTHGFLTPNTLPPTPQSHMHAQPHPSHSGAGASANGFCGPTSSTSLAGAAGGDDEWRLPRMVGV